MALRVTVLGYSDRGVMTEAERAEAYTFATYEDALQRLIPPSARDLVEHQRAQIVVAHHRAQVWGSH